MESSDDSLGEVLRLPVNGPGSSFSEFLKTQSPELLPKRDLDGRVETPEGTTVLALRFSDGVIVAGDRRATEGFQIAHRSIEKVFAADDMSAVAIAGAAGPAVEMVRLFQVELEHYEKVEGERLSLEGKANKLSQMIRANLPAAMQGLIVIPLFAGYDESRGLGRIFKYDVTGGRYEEHDHHSVGSGSVFARGALKKLWRPDLPQDQAVRVALEALYDAADDDSATGGPDLTRRIFPVVSLVTADGYRRLSDDEVGAIVDGVVAARMESPGGPQAPLR